MKRQAVELLFGDPAELPASMRRPLARSEFDATALLPWRADALQMREAVIYGTYTSQTWRLDACASKVDQIEQTVADLINHIGVALLSGYRTTTLWQIVEVELVAGVVLPLPSVSVCPLNVQLAFAATSRVPVGAVIGRDIRTATKCYVGCRRRRGDFGIIEIGAEEKRSRNAEWRARIDGTRVLRCTGVRPHFYFAPWREARRSASATSVPDLRSGQTAELPASVRPVDRKARNSALLDLPREHGEALAALQAQASVAVEMLRTFQGPEARTSAARKQRRQLRIRLQQAQLVMGQYRREVDTIICLAARSGKTIPELTPDLRGRLLQANWRSGIPS